MRDVFLGHLFSEGHIYIDLFKLSANTKKLRCPVDCQPIEVSVYFELSFSVTNTTEMTSHFLSVRARGSSPFICFKCCGFLDGRGFTANKQPVLRLLTLVAYASPVSKFPRMCHENLICTIRLVLYCSLLKNPSKNHNCTSLPTLYQMS